MYRKSQLHNKLFENHFFQKPTPYINHPTNQHCRSKGWSQYDTNPFRKGFFHRLWYCYSLIYQLQQDVQVFRFCFLITRRV